MLNGGHATRSACCKARRPAVRHASMPADAALATSLGAKVCTGWQKSSGYDRRALAEAATSHYNRVIGDALRSRADRRQATEVAITVLALNRMLEFGRPEFVRLA